MIRTLVVQRLMPVPQWLPRDSYFWAKALLLALIAIQLARLMWTLATPVGPLGAWRPAEARLLAPATQAALISTFDPFNRGGPLAVQAQAAVSLDIQLFGTREGGEGVPGSAILAGPDGLQASIAVGEEFQPGVRLVGVGFDHVVVERSGNRHSIFMNPQAGAGSSASPAPAGTSPALTAPAPAPAPAAAGPGPLTAEAIRQNIAFAPRSEGSRVTGLLVSPVGEDSTLRAAGLRGGDVIVALGGRPIRSTADLAALQSRLAPGARLMLTVERGAQTAVIALNLPEKR